MRPKDRRVWLHSRATGKSCRRARSSRWSRREFVSARPINARAEKQARGWFVRRAAPASDGRNQLERWLLACAIA